VYLRPQPDSTQRTTKTGKVVNEVFFRDVSGLIKKIEEKTTDFGRLLSLTVSDGDDKYIIDMNFSSRYASSLLRCFPNLDLTKDVKIMPWEMNDKQDATKKITGITCYQDDGGWAKILPGHTKDNPNGLPPMVKVKVKGQEVWDDSEMMVFLFSNAVSKLNSVEEAPF
jgi:hypothetical protein